MGSCCSFTRDSHGASNVENVVGAKKDDKSASLASASTNITRRLVSSAEELPSEYSNENQTAKANSKTRNNTNSTSYMRSRMDC